MEEKEIISKKDSLILLAKIVEESNSESKKQLLSFIEKENNKIEIEEQRIKEREIDQEILNNIESLLTNEFQTIEELITKINNKKIAKIRLAMKLAQLERKGIIESTNITNEATKRIDKAYKLIQ